jgi:hypothetical protein
MVASGTIAQILGDIAVAGYSMLRSVGQIAFPDIAASLGTTTVDPRTPEPVRIISPQELVAANPNTWIGLPGSME